MAKMKAVELAASEGTRLCPLTGDGPKALGEVDGRPILTYCFESLAELGIDELVIVDYAEGREGAERRPLNADPVEKR